MSEQISAKSTTRVQKMSQIRNRLKFKINYTAKFFLDFLCIFLVGLPVLLYYLVGKPYERGLFCDDESLKYPFKESTVTNKVLYSVGVLLPVSFMLLIETLQWKFGKRDTSNDNQITMFGREVPPLLFQWYRKIGVFLFGACVSQFATDIAKYNIGRLRPHFFDVCQPNLTVDICTKGYIPEIVCINTDLIRIREARLSFPSGHASFSAYTMVYLAVYLQARMTWRTNYLLRPVLQVFILYMAWYTGLSRVTDNKHHWSDVLVGLLLGTSVALLIARFVSDLFVRNPEAPENRAILSVNRDVPSNYDTCTLQIDEKPSEVP